MTERPNNTNLLTEQLQNNPVVALEDLGLVHLHIVYPGKTSYPLDTAISALSINDLYSTI